MTASEIYKSAIALLDTSAIESDIKEVLPRIAIGAVNDIGTDLFGEFVINDIFEEIPLKQSELSAFVYGVAMVLSAAFGLVEKNVYLTDCYNKKRATIKSKSERVKNTMPYTLGEIV